MTDRLFNFTKALLVFVLLSMLSTSYWMFRTFSVVSLSQTATVLSLDMEAGATPHDLTRHFFLWAFVVPLLVMGILGVSAWLEHRGRRLASLVVLAALVPGMVAFCLKMNFDYFAPASTVATRRGNIFEQYLAPAIPRQSQAKPLNVVWIFVESLEKEYSETGMNEELNRSTAFMTPLRVTPLVNRFTVGAVMSAKCGAPIYFTRALVLHFGSPGFNHASCFDDVLRSNGYHSYFVVGHDANLSGFRGYYERHASAEIYDQKYLELRGVTKNSDFETYPDEQVFETALEILKSSSIKSPYSLNILTYDNHAPDGLPSRRCKSEYGSDIADVIRCDNHALAAFIEELKREGVLENTVLVVMGDHPYSGTFSQTLADREIFARIYTPLSDKKVLNNNPSPFDFFPSVLSAMGFEVGQQRYGYGYSFYDVQAYPEKDWKRWLDTFPSSQPTASYRALHE